MNRKWMKSTFIYLMFLMSLLTGCWDRVEVNDVALVSGTAIDKAGEKYRVSIQIPLPGQMGGAGSQGGGGGTGGNGPWNMEIAEGRTIHEANAIQQQSLSRRLNFSHRRILLLGEELSKEGVSPVLDVLVRVPENRMSSLIAVTEGQAGKMLSSHTPYETLSAEMLRELTQQSMKGLPSLRYFTENLLKEGIDPMLPYLILKQGPADEEKSKQSIKMDGFAVFDQDRMTGVLKGDQAAALLLALNQMESLNLQIPVPKGKGYLEIQLQHGRAAVKPLIEGDQIRMKLDIGVRGWLVENVSNYDLTSNANFEEIEGAIRKKLKSDLKQTIHLLQTKLHSDPLGFGEAVHLEYPSVWVKMREQWKKDYYPQVKSDVVIKIHLEHTGAITKPIGWKEGELIR